MPVETFLSLIGLAIAATITPGPNNTLVAASGARFGFRATMPHVIGIGIGFPFMNFVIAMGLGQAFQQSSLLRETVRISGIVILLWLAWKIASSKGSASNTGSDQPFTLWQSAAFQWINPKAWVMAIGITTQFVSTDATWITSGIIAVVLLITAVLSSTTWTLFGVGMQRWLNTDNRLRAFNCAMAALILISVLGIGLSEL